MTRKTVCPSCKGTGKSYVFYNNGPDYRTHTSGFETCTACQGKVAIPLTEAKKLETRLRNINRIRNKMDKHVLLIREKLNEKTNSDTTEHL